MSETVATAAASPDFVKIGKPGDVRTLRMSPLHLKAMGMYERWVQGRMGAAAKTITAETPELANDLMKKIVSTGYWSEEALGVLLTVDGQIMICWLGVSISEPQISFNWFSENIQESQLKEAMAMHSRLNYPEVESKKGEPATGPNALATETSATSTASS